MSIRIRTLHVSFNAVFLKICLNLPEMLRSLGLHVKKVLVTHASIT